MIVRILKQLLNAQIASSIKELALDDDESSDQFSHPRHDPIIRNPKSIIKNRSKGEFQNRSIDKSLRFDERNSNLNRSIDKPGVENLDESQVDTNIGNDKCNEWYQDFLNLVFGKDPETEDFYKAVVFPRVASYYNYPIQSLEKYKFNFIAMYYSLLYHCGLEVSKEQELFKRLGKTEKPFEEDNRVR